MLCYVHTISNPSSFYLEEGFLHLQNAVSQSIVEFLAKKTMNLKVSVEVSLVVSTRIQSIAIFPRRNSNFLILHIVWTSFFKLLEHFSLSFWSWPFSSPLEFWLRCVQLRFCYFCMPMLVTNQWVINELLSYKYILFLSGIFIQELVLEKESRIRETMLMMGLKQWTLWSSWYLKQFIFFMISVILICILVKVSYWFPKRLDNCESHTICTQVGRIFPRSDFILLLIFFCIFVLSMISFCFLIRWLPYIIKTCILPCLF